MRDAMIWCDAVMRALHNLLPLFRLKICVVRMNMR
jgi:hypothetical protein